LTWEYPALFLLGWFLFPLCQAALDGSLPLLSLRHFLLTKNSIIAIGEVFGLGQTNTNDTHGCPSGKGLATSVCVQFRMGKNCYAVQCILRWRALSPGRQGRNAEAIVATAMEEEIRPARKSSQAAVGRVGIIFGQVPGRHFMPGDNGHCQVFPGNGRVPALD
jgi:hypothetical protein